MRAPIPKGQEVGREAGREAGRGASLNVATLLTVFAQLRAALLSMIQNIC
jgi:hypothetical protein